MKITVTGLKYEYHWHFVIQDPALTKLVLRFVLTVEETSTGDCAHLVRLRGQRDPKVSLDRQWRRIDGLLEGELMEEVGEENEELHFGELLSRTHTPPCGIETKIGGEILSVVHEMYPVCFYLFIIPNQDVAFQVMLPTLAQH